MSGSIQMPKYKCHKEVWALKIEKVKADNAGRTYLHFADERYAPIEIANGWLMKHMPVPGGYYVQYEDGYASYSPAKAFESGYALIGESESSTYYDQLCKFYDVQGRGGLIDALLKHIDDLQEAAKRNVKPWEDTFPPTLLPAYIQKIDNGSHMALQSMAAQIAGIKDEIADFMAGLDGALLAGKSIEDLHDEIMERIALYDTPEAVDLFMQMVKGRSGVELPELVKEIIQQPAAAEEKWIFTVETKDYAPFKIVSPDIGAAFAEFTSEQVWLASKTGSTEIPVDEIERYENITARTFLASNGFKVSWYSAAAIAEVMGNAKASNPLPGKYISATATVIDAYQLPLRKDVIANEFVEWAREHGVKWSTESPDALQVHRGYGDLLMDAFPGEWVAKCNKGAVHVFEPEVFATLYTSAAELLK